ncbi:MAG: hypothetical protein OXE53_11200 [Deltaproteobacteria bacterium]|nr:hypothetical protein [Deltaproteobacteria bacterium]
MAEATAVTGTSAFRRPPAMDVDLIDLTDRKGTEHWMECGRAMNRRKLAGSGLARSAIVVIRERRGDAPLRPSGRKAFSGGRKQ